MTVMSKAQERADIERLTREFLARDNKVYVARKTGKYRAKPQGVTTKVGSPTVHENRSWEAVAVVQNYKGGSSANYGLRGTFKEEGLWS